LGHLGLLFFYCLKHDLIISYYVKKSSYFLNKFYFAGAASTGDLSLEISVVLFFCNFSKVDASKRPHKHFVFLLRTIFKGCLLVCVVRERQYR